jgi:hypothetical protein
MLISNQILLEHKYKKAKSIAKKVGNKRKILLLGSSHSRETGPMLKESLGKGYIFSVFLSQMLLLQTSLKSWGSLVKILTSRIISL